MNYARIMFTPTMFSRRRMGLLWSTAGRSGFLVGVEMLRVLIYVCYFHNICIHLCVYVYVTSLSLYDIYIYTHTYIHTHIALVLCRFSESDEKPPRRYRVWEVSQRRASMQSLERSGVCLVLPRSVTVIPMSRC